MTTFKIAKKPKVTMSQTKCQPNFGKIWTSRKKARPLIIMINSKDPTKKDRKKYSNNIRSKPSKATMNKSLHSCTQNLALPYTVHPFQPPLYTLKVSCKIL